MNKSIIFLLFVLFPLTGMAKEDVICPPDKPWLARHTCYSCDTLQGVFAKNCPDICPNRIYKDHQCILKTCPPEAPLRDMEFGTCYTCDEKEDIWTEGAFECAVCENRTFYETSSQCVLACPEEKPIKIKKDRNTGEFSCFSCDEPEALLINYLKEDTCLQCPQRDLIDGYCVLKKCPESHPILDEHGGCRSPNDPRLIRLKNPGECAKYPNRYSEFDSLCELKTCPDDKPMRIQRDCVSCQDNPVYTDAKTCAQCPNRKLYRYSSNGREGTVCALPCPTDKPLPDNEGNCHVCDESILIRTNECHLCPNRLQEGEFCNLQCPADKPLQDKEGKCHTCDEIGQIEVVSKEVCDVCPQRVIDRHDECVLCPADKPIVHENGKCFSCDELEAIKLAVGQQGTNVCPEQRVLTSEWSRLKNCPPDKPLQDKDGTCHSCEQREAYSGLTINVFGVEENCSVCPNRQLIGQYCMPPCPADKPVLDIYGSFSYCRSCDDKGDYGVGLVKINVTGAEEICSLCPNRRLRQENRFGRIETFCVPE